MKYVLFGLVTASILVGFLFIGESHNFSSQGWWLLIIPVVILGAPTNILLLIVFGVFEELIEGTEFANYFFNLLKELGWDSFMFLSIISFISISINVAYISKWIELRKENRVVD